MRAEDLVAAAREAAELAYAPYSNFAVGAALLLDDGSVITGANVENASYGLSLCAETVAIAKAANAGKLGSVREVAIIAPSHAAPIFPCGRCRQVLNETGRDLLVHCASGDGAAIARRLLSSLLPDAFGPADLVQTRSIGPG